MASAFLFETATTNFLWKCFTYRPILLASPFSSSSCSCCVRYCVQLSTEIWLVSRQKKRIAKCNEYLAHASATYEKRNRYFEKIENKCCGPSKALFEYRLHHKFGEKSFANGNNPICRNSIVYWLWCFSSMLRKWFWLIHMISSIIQFQSVSVRFLHFDKTENWKRAFPCLLHFVSALVKRSIAKTKKRNKKKPCKMRTCSMRILVWGTVKSILRFVCVRCDT